MGQKKPNDLGLFDMDGNVWNWCQNGWGSYQPGKGGAAAEDEEDTIEISDRLSRVLRGGAFYVPPALARCAFRNLDRPSLRYKPSGLRVARTYP